MPDINEQLNQVEWAEDQSSRVDSPRKKPKWLLPFLVALTVIIVFVVVILIASSLLNNKSLSNEVEQEMVAAEFDCQEARDVEKCLVNASPRLARQSGDITYCKDLEGNDFDSCVSGAAKTALDSSLCKKIVDSDRQITCKDAVLALSNDLSSPIDYCYEFSNPRIAEDCARDWITSKIISGDCNYDEISDELCTIGSQYNIAISAQDPDLCKDINDPVYILDCEAFVSPGDRDFDNLDADEEDSYGSSDTNTDSDGDGLMDGEEVYNFGTDPANPDTDGDGFTDGEEVLAGFDPLS